jgi:hypothetical protein
MAGLPIAVIGLWRRRLGAFYAVKGRAQIRSKMGRGLTQLEAVLIRPGQRVMRKGFEKGD